MVEAKVRVEPGCGHEARIRERVTTQTLSLTLTKNAYGGPNQTLSNTLVSMSLVGSLSCVLRLAIINHLIHPLPASW